MQTGRLTATIALALGFVIWSPDGAAAQICGDANGSGSVTVTDGVQVLRAAAGLSSECSAAVCDVNGSGGITVTDGVLTLRIAAALPADTACPMGGAAEVASVTDAVLPFLTFGVSIAADAVTSAVPAQEVDECPAGGTRERSMISPSILRIELVACRFVDPQLGSFQFDRRILVNFARGEVGFLLDVTDLASGVMVTFEGTIVGTATGDGGFVVDGGPVTLTTPQGDFELNFDNLTIDAEGDPIAGSGSASDTDDNFALASISLTATGGPTADVLATFDDGSTAVFVLDLETGALTPVS